MEGQWWLPPGRRLRQAFQPQPPEKETVSIVMAPTEKRRVEKRGGEGGPKGEEPKGKSLTERGRKIREDIDQLLDEIDEVLEENAEEFVRNYVQRGGE